MHQHQLPSLAKMKQKETNNFIKLVKQNHIDVPFSQRIYVNKIKRLALLLTASNALKQL
uniref:Uncharacterized protein n=1 Tax=Anguilla anguilla TaxID=7936 RepID=A0A0E9SRJ7_ANGAN